LLDTTESLKKSIAPELFAVHLKMTENGLFQLTWLRWH